MNKASSFLLLGLLALAGGVNQAAPLGTAFTYQGRLEQNGQTATNGVYGMKFALYDDPNAGGLLGTNLLAVPVTNGLFTASLDFGGAIFAGEARWLEIGVNTNNGTPGYAILLPRTRIAPTPNAIFASTAGTVPNGAIQAGQLGTIGTPTAGQVLGYNGSALVWQAPGGGGTWSLNASNGSVFYNNGRVGIGTNQPSGALHVASGGVAITGSSSPFIGAGQGMFLESSGIGGGLFAYDYGTGSPKNLLLNSPGGNVGIGTTSPQAKLHLSGLFSELRLESTRSLSTAETQYKTDAKIWHTGVGGSGAGEVGNKYFVYDANAGLYRLVVDAAGNVGIGTTTPIAKLDVSGRVLAPQLSVAGDDQDQLNFSYAGQTALMANYGVSRGPVNPSVGAPIVGVSGWAGLGLFTSSANRLWVTKEGNVGIGTSDPQARLDVAGDVSWGTSLLKSDQGGAIELGHSLGNGNTPYLDFHYGVGVTQDFNVRLINDADGRLTCSGNFSVCSLTIRGGCDLAEPFPMKEEQIDKGSVVVIDEEHPGRLKLSTRAYDTQVAGIVSGANGINPGIALKQEDVLDSGHNVALTGRVYVKADASHGAIRPGDLLTTSDTPGHAMKVTDHARAQGAILGKAMSALHEGTGLVLVLVTLQ